MNIINIILARQSSLDWQLTGCLAQCIKQTDMQLSITNSQQRNVRSRKEIAHIKGE